MFGFIQANMQTLSNDEKNRYRQMYCGLCHTLGERYGISSKFSLTYDLTFLSILLSSLYEPDDFKGECICMAHPFQKHKYIKNHCTEYAADMTVALTYHKCMDDWKDDHNIAKRCYAAILSDSYGKVKKLYPVQCGIIEQELKLLSEIEENQASSPDAGANAFGNLMSSVFIYKNDNWSDVMNTLGYGLGRYIYFADAAIDFEHDKKHGNYNPFAKTNINSEELRNILKTILGTVSEAFESLPLVQDVNILRNILYSGIWIKYNRNFEKRKEEQSKW